MKDAAANEAAEDTAVADAAMADLVVMVDVEAAEEMVAVVADGAVTSMQRWRTLLQRRCIT